jgi:hypothetical protein
MILFNTLGSPPGLQTTLTNVFAGPQGGYFLGTGSIVCVTVFYSPETNYDDVFYVFSTLI